MTYVLITSGHDGDDTSIEESLDSAVDGFGKITAKRHVHNSLAGDALLLGIVNDKLHTLEDARVAATARGIENLDSDEVNFLGDTKGSTTDSTSNVGAVAVLVVILNQRLEKTVLFLSSGEHTLLLIKLAPKVARPSNSVWVIRIPVSTT